MSAVVCAQLILYCSCSVANLHKDVLVPLVTALPKHTAGSYHQPRKMECSAEDVLDHPVLQSYFDDLVKELALILYGTAGWERQVSHSSRRRLMECALMTPL